jgi:hypothetical protein
MSSHGFADRGEAVCCRAAGRVPALADAFAFAAALMTVAQQPAQDLPGGIAAATCPESGADREVSYTVVPGDTRRRRRAVWRRSGAVY